jgi:hypothetical protein
MLLQRFSNLGTSQLQSKSHVPSSQYPLTPAEPIYLFCFCTLVVALVFNSLLLAGCTSATPGLRKFYLVSLHYNTESTKSSIITDLDKVLSSDKGKNGTFNYIRIGYRGICIETKKDNNSDLTWNCAKHGKDIAKDLGGDPLDLVTVGDLYKDKISFSTPLWASLISLGIGFLMVVANCIPVVPIPKITKKIAAGAAGLGALMLLGSMVLQQVTTSAIATLVGHLGMKAVLIHVGHANVGFGWAAFATAFAAAIGTLAVAAAEMAVERIETKTEQLMERGLDKATGGRVGVQDIRGFNPTAYNPNSFPPPPQSSESRKTFGKGGISLVQNIMAHKTGR